MDHIYAVGQTELMFIPRVCWDSCCEYLCDNLEAMFLNLFRWAKVLAASY